MPPRAPPYSRPKRSACDNLMRDYLKASLRRTSFQRPATCLGRLGPQRGSRFRVPGNRPEVTQRSASSGTIDSGSSAATETVIAGAMTCDEDVRLKAVYDAALCAWLKHRQGLLGGPRRKTTFQLRKQLLQSRWKAAEDLYEHSLTCPICKASANRRFDGD
jgi:hypothetical protein